MVVGFLTPQRNAMTLAAKDFVRPIFFRLGRNESVYFGGAVPQKLPGLKMMPFKIAFSLKQTSSPTAQFAWLETPEKPWGCWLEGLGVSTFLFGVAKVEEQPATPV